MRQTFSRLDMERLAALRRALGHAVPADVLWMADGVRLSGGYLARFVSDAMVAAWIATQTAQARFPELADPAALRRFLGWYCLERTPTEPDGPGAVDDVLQALHTFILAATDRPDRPLTGLIDIAAAHMLPPDPAPRAPDAVAWFHGGGAAALGIAHHVAAAPGDATAPATPATVVALPMRQADGAPLARRLAPARRAGCRPGQDGLRLLLHGEWDLHQDGASPRPPLGTLCFAWAGSAAAPARLGLGLSAAPDAAALRLVLNGAPVWLGTPAALRQPDLVLPVPGLADGPNLLQCVPLGQSPRAWSLRHVWVAAA